VGGAAPKADVTVSAAVGDGSTTGGVPVGDVYATTIVQLVGFATPPVAPPKTNGLAGQVPPAGEYNVLPLRAEVKVNGVSATLLTVTVFVLGTPGPRSLKTTGLGGVTVGTVPVPLRVAGSATEVVIALTVLVAMTVIGSLDAPVAVGLNVTFIVQEPLAATPPAQPVVSTEKGAETPLTVTPVVVVNGSIGDVPAVRVNASVVTLAPRSTVPDEVAVTVWPKAAPLARRRAEAASPDLIRRDLRILNRIVVLPES
jgi:hypothetical protein